MVAAECPGLKLADGESICKRRDQVAKEAVIYRDVRKHRATTIGDCNAVAEPAQTRSHVRRAAAERATRVVRTGYFLHHFNSRLVRARETINQCRTVAAHSDRSTVAV